MSIIDQKEYLKRYLSGGDPKSKKRRKKKHPVVKRTMVIVDDDVDIKALAPSEETVQKVEEELYDDAPTVAGLVDERPEADQIIEEYRQSTKWKGLKDKRDEQQTNQNDISPLRGSNDDISPVRSRNRHDSDGDVSPVRTSKRHDSDSDHSPQRSKMRPDLSPVRSSHRHDSDVDLSPVMTRKRHDSDSDLSPQRSRRRKNSDGDLSSVRTKKRHDSDSDLSPRRSKARHDSDSDLSPIRAKKKDASDSDLSPERSFGKKNKSKHERKGQNQRGDRKQEETDSDLSPPRGKAFDKSGKLKKTLSGHTAGLQNARTLKHENEANRRRQDRIFEAMGDEALGKHSATVFRDKAGKRRDLAKEREEEKEAAAKKAKEDEQFMEWGKGVAQKERQEQLVVDAAREMTKPLARYQDDEDLDSFLKEQDREGDPMLAMIRKKKVKERELAGIKEKPKYRGPAPQPNRFKIAPGYRWDGVDRSNGFERKYFARTANKKAMQEVKYKWSVEDM